MVFWKFGQLIRERRQSLKIKIYELAKKVGISAPYLTEIEIKDKIPSPEVFNKINRELGNSIKLHAAYYFAYRDTEGYICGDEASLLNRIIENYILGDGKARGYPIVKKPDLIKKIIEDYIPENKSNKKVNELIKKITFDLVAKTEEYRERLKSSESDLYDILINKN